MGEAHQAVLILVFIIVVEEDYVDELLMAHMDAIINLMDTIRIVVISGLPNLTFLTTRRS